MSFFITATKGICFSGWLRWQKMSPLEALKVTLVTFWMIAQINRYCVIVLQMYYTTERGRWTITANKKQQTFSHKGPINSICMCKPCSAQPQLYLLQVSILHHTLKLLHLSCSCFIWAALASPHCLRCLSSVSFRLLLCMPSDSRSISRPLCLASQASPLK